VIIIQTRKKTLVDPDLRQFVVEDGEDEDVNEDVDEDVGWTKTHSGRGWKKKVV
jgi:hypothetical protein